MNKFSLYADLRRCRLPLFALLILLLVLSRFSEIALRAAEPGKYDPGRLEVTLLVGELQRPMELAVAADGRIYFIELAGQLRRFDPKSGTTETIGEVPVTTANENGLIGLALDPNFSENGWLYLQYSPPDYPGQHISRFTLNQDKFDLQSEKLLFKFEEQRRECCHHAGSLAFGPDGCLYIGTGDNTHPFGDSQSYAPIDERPGREPWDAQKSAANSKSGAGKVLRIRPTPQGGYEVPEGNLFSRDGSEGLPEIYVMGCRNPWRISVDANSGFLYWGDVGPDAGGDGPRGPRGYDEINQARTAGNFGWPYFIANNKAYHDVDFTTGKVGAAFDSEKPINDSPNNKGARDLPPAQPALLYYPSAGSPEFPELNGAGGRTACAGPVYHYNPALKSETKFPEHFDNVLFIYEWSRHWIKAVHLDADGIVASIQPFMPKQPFVRPIDMQFGPDGSLYLIEYGSTWGVNQNARLIRIDYASGNRRPVAKASAANNVGRQPLEVSFSSEGTFDKDPGDTLKYQWRLFKSGEAAPEILSEEANPTLTFNEPGVFNVELLVTDASGANGSAAAAVVVGNARPKVRILQPASGSFFDPHRPVEYKIHVRDFEDGTSDFDEAEDEGIDFLDAEAPSRITVNASIASGNSDDPEDGPPGMRLMKRSDCFNCHDINQKRVGPPLVEIANKYRHQPQALGASVKRVRAGSSGVWGKIPMIPHTQHTEEEVAEMVSWIYSLEADGGLRVFHGFVGQVPPEAREEGPSGNLALEATYIDRGAKDIPPLSDTVRVVLRNRRIDAELADQIHGPLTLDSATAHGGKFLGAINHGHFSRFGGIDLAQVGKISVRVSSAGAGGTIEVRRDKPDGPKLASFEVKVNGQWEDWRELTQEIEKSEGAHDLYFVFANPARQSALMNLDSVYFHPSSDSQ